MIKPIFEKCPMCGGKMSWNEKNGAGRNGKVAWNDCSSDDASCLFTADVFLSGDAEIETGYRSFESLEEFQRWLKLRSFE